MNAMVSPPLSPQKDEFHSQLDLYRKTFPYRPDYLGMHNPYDKTVIRSPDDYDRYLREKLYHDLCERAAVQELHRRTTKYFRFFLLFAAALTLFFCLVVLPAAGSSSQSTGYNLGYQSGYDAGRASVRSSGASSGSSSGSSSGISSPTKLPASAQLPSDQNKTTTVYITATGHKYHRYSCSYLANSCYSISLSDAVNSGYGPCSRCKPPT
ncbi:MAG: hypothetical protein PUD76_09320 [Clostridia bacterium]|nr:hypothetical protein [Clostridia bacterium]